MKETSTPKPPEGLEGYMEEVNEYHDIIDDTRELRKPAFCICGNKGADQLQGNRAAD